jgi:RNA polymerase sigma-70 factor (ECF subfamily)
MLRSRTARREVVLEAAEPASTGPGPEQEAVLADSVGVALLVVLDTLTPAERLAFVLHDTFNIPFERIAAILDRSVPATKMLASRARRRVRAGRSVATDLPGRWRLVEAFLAASRAGDFSALLDLLDPDVSARADAAASPTARPTVVTGADDVARQALAFARRARHAHVGLVDGTPAILVMPRGKLAVVLTFTFAGGRIGTVDVIADPARLARIAPAAGSP